jgi:hypothetical protein
MRLMSFALTTQQIRDRSKTVTRRIGWKDLPTGTLLQPVVKSQGLKKGERVERINGPIRTVNVREEPLRLLLEDREYGRREVDLEGFPELSIEEFVSMFLKSHRPSIGQPHPLDAITRIEFEYVDEETT